MRGSRGLALSGAGHRRRAASVERKDAIVSTFRDGKVAGSTTSRPGGGPRSRRNLGVGDVAGERGDRARHPPGVEHGGHERRSALYDSDAVVRPPEGWPEPGPLSVATRWSASSRDARDMGRQRGGTFERPHRRGRPSCRSNGLAMEQGTAPSPTWSSQRSIRCERQGRLPGSSGTTPMPSKPWGWRRQDAHADS